MFHSVLENLRSDRFAIEFSFISNPRALHRALQRSEDVEELRNALGSGVISEETIRVFSADLLKEFQQGKRLPNELALAAFAVAFEARLTPFAEEFVMDLAKLKLAELPIAIRVARHACQERLKLSDNKTKLFRISGEDTVPKDWQEAPEPQKVNIGQSSERFLLEAS